LEQLPVGPADVTVRRTGYRPVQRATTVVAGTTMQLDVTMAEAATILTPIVVSATRDRRSLAEVPVAVSVADETTIQSGRTAGLHEVLRLTPGVQATSRFGLDDVNLSIRGSGVRTTFGVRGVAVVVDGVPVTEPDGRLGSTRTRHGTSGRGGPGLPPRCTADGGGRRGQRDLAVARGSTRRHGGSGGSFGFRKYDGTVGAATKDGRLGGYLSGTWTESDGFRINNTNLMKRLNLRGDWQAAARTRVTLEASTSDLDMTIPGALTKNESRRCRSPPSRRRWLLVRPPRCVARGLKRTRA
jgi:iron complex outermembrane receptor protein